MLTGVTISRLFHLHAYSHIGHLARRVSVVRSHWEWMPVAELNFNLHKPIKSLLQLVWPDDLPCSGYQSVSISDAPTSHSQSQRANYELSWRSARSDSALLKCSHWQSNVMPDLLLKELRQLFRRVKWCGGNISKGDGTHGAGDAFLPGF